jgi:signal transduction histidine kinase
VTEPSVQLDVIRGIESALHEMCQPLTVLRCRLELAGLDGSLDAMRDAIVDSVQQCARLNATVETIRDLVIQAMEDNDRSGVCR